MRSARRVPIFSRGFLAILAVIGLAMTACSGVDDTEAASTAEGDGAETPSTTGSDEAGADDVTLLLSFLPDMVAIQHLIAEDLGYYDQCGINFSYESAAEVENPLQLLVGGAVDYAVVDPLSYVSGVARGLPIMAIAEDSAKTPISWASFAEEGIEEPQDLPGKVVGIQPGLDSSLYFNSVINRELSAEEAEQVNQVPVGFDIQPLLAGTVDVITLWPTNANINLLQAEGQEFNLIRASDYGIEVSGNLLVTTTERVDQNPDQVLRFLTAVTAGQLANLDPANAELAVEVVERELGEDLPTDVGVSMFEEVGKLKVDPVWDEKGVGLNREASYEQLNKFLVQEDQIDEPVAMEELFTKEFLEKIFPDGRDSFAIDSICG
jgi:NitT/TauT family transport system substrate-binding protein